MFVEIVRIRYVQIQSLTEKSIYHGTSPLQNTVPALDAIETRTRS
jgi:hypothetical protein